MNLSMHTKRFYDNGKISDHHAIVPTEKQPNLDKLNTEEKKIRTLQDGRGQHSLHQACFSNLLCS